MKTCWKCNGAGVLCRHCHRATDTCHCADGMPLDVRSCFEEDPPNERCLTCSGSGQVRTNYAGTVRECPDIQEEHPEATAREPWRGGPL